MLLTGATGFLGVFVLAELLAHTRAQVVCLVRAGDPEAARARVLANARRYGIAEPLARGRLEFVCGDLEREGLGLEPAARRRLTHGAQALDAIYHCGAQVSWLQPYRKLRETNVGGLLRVMRLAAEAGGAQLHYVSSLGAALIRPFEARAMIDEVLARSGLGRESIVELPLGYFESKWVGGRLLAAAREAGLPCTLYGPGLIAGHSRSGVDSLSSAQFVHALIEGSAQLGMFPDARGWRFIPVDFAAQQIVGLSQLDAARGRDLYLDSAVSLEPEHVLEALAAHGYDTRMVSYSVWRQRVLELADAGERDNALFGFTDVIYTLTPLRMLGQEHQLDWYRANAGAPDEVRAQLGERRYLDRAQVRRLIDYYVAAGAMPSPA